MKKEISLRERKQIQLGMLKEVDTFCQTNNIRYSLAFGTLLGAIRHKGYIPWDDDVDIMMPLPDMLRFKETFKSKELKYCDVDTESYYEYAFSRIVHMGTYDKKGLIYKQYGINIDLYPIISIPCVDKEKELFFQKAEKFQKRRLRLMEWRRRCVKYLPIKTIYGHEAAIRKYRDYMFNTPRYGSTGLYYIIGGPLHLKERMTYNQDLFKNLISVKFEGVEFQAISQYDYYMRLRYGDYMQLPPIEERHPYHGGHYYWK